LFSYALSLAPVCDPRVTPVARDVVKE
jgi:hypothetical protein